LKIIVKTLIALTGLSVLIVLFHFEEDWRGKHAWENCKRELEAKGEALDWNAYIPAPVPDDQNIFKAPKMQEWFVGRSETDLSKRLANSKTPFFGESSQITNEVEAKNYLAWSDQFTPDFDLIRSALKRPYARMEGDYKPLVVPVPNFVTVRIVAQTLAQRAHCYLLLNQPEQALAELTTMHDMCRLLEDVPTGKPTTLVSAMIDVAVAGLYVDIVAEGFRRQAWQKPQLITLQRQLGQIHLTPFVVGAIRQERAGMCYIIENNMLPRIKDVRAPYLMRGCLYQNLVTIAHLEQEAIDSFDPERNAILLANANNLQREVVAMGKRKFLKPYTFLAAIAVPNLTRAFQTLGRNQTSVDEAQIACTLERCRLAHGEYPEKLDALAPQFIEKIPNDIINGQPLHYRRTADGKFMLYSVGWNEKDDSGVASDEISQGDWVWKN